MHLENIVCNITGGVRREQVGKREYVVVPLTMLVPGVLNGSQGPLLYPADEVEASTPFWDGMIVTDGHIPAGSNGRRLQTQEKFAIGVIQNPVFNKGRLQAEAWLDVLKTRRTNGEILRAINANEKLEVSTGLLTVGDEYVEGVHNGRPYNRIARNFRPDHLAILVNKRGACSIEDGCGILNSGRNGPVGGSLGHSEMDWGSPQLPDSRRVVSKPRHGGPVGGALGHLEINWDQPTEPPQQRQQQQPNAIERRDGPVGGALGPSPPVF